MISNGGLKKTIMTLIRPDNVKRRPRWSLTTRCRLARCANRRWEGRFTPFLKTRVRPQLVVVPIPSLRQFYSPCLGTRRQQLYEHRQLREVT